MRYLRPFRKTVSHSESHQLSVLFFEDISEIALLRHQVNTLLTKVEELQLNDELTGLPNKKAFMHSLHSQVSRTRRYGNPLSILSLNMYSSSNHTLQDASILETAYCLRDRLRWVDTIGHIEPGHFMMLLPETGEQDASALVDKIKSGLSENKSSLNDITFNIGQASWQQGQDSYQLIEVANENAKKGEPLLICSD